jgi:hypothetical protein
VKDGTVSFSVRTSAPVDATVELAGYSDGALVAARRCAVTG